MFQYETPLLQLIAENCSAQILKIILDDKRTFQFGGLLPIWINMDIDKLRLLVEYGYNLDVSFNGFTALQNSLRIYSQDKALFIFQFVKIFVQSGVDMKGNKSPILRACMAFSENTSYMDALTGYLIKMGAETEILKNSARFSTKESLKSEMKKRSVLGTKKNPLVGTYKELMQVFIDHFKNEYQIWNTKNKKWKE